MRPEDVLGVRRGASRDEARAAYLRLVREHHPDAHTGASEAVRAHHARRMAEVTRAWAELARRRPDGRTFDDPRSDPRSDGVSGDDLGPDDLGPDDLGPDDLGRDDPRPLTASRPGSRMVVVPGLLVAASPLVFFVGVMLRASRLLALAVVLGLMGGLLFLVTPFLVMARAARDERR